MSSTGHYSYAQRPKDLYRAAEELVEKLEAELRKSKYGKDCIPIFCYRGMSGVATATAVSMLWSQKHEHYGMIYVRKDHEQSHGQDVEYDISSMEGWRIEDKKKVLVFVDDFVSSGATRRVVFEKIRDSYIGRSPPSNMILNEFIQLCTHYSYEEPKVLTFVQCDIRFLKESEPEESYSGMDRRDEIPTSTPLVSMAADLTDMMRGAERYLAELEGTSSFDAWANLCRKDLATEYPLRRRSNPKEYFTFEGRPNRVLLWGESPPNANEVENANA